MAKRIYPRYWSQWFNRMAIHPGTKNNPPSVVFVTHVSRGGRLVGTTLNSGVVYVGKPLYLIEYSPRLFIRLKAVWEIKNAKLTIETEKKRALTGKY